MGLRVIARPPRIIEKTRLIEVVKQIMTRAARCAITTSAKTIDITILNLIYRGVVRQGEGCLGLDYGRLPIRILASMERPAGMTNGFR